MIKSNRTAAVDSQVNSSLVRMFKLAAIQSLSDLTGCPCKNTLSGHAELVYAFREGKFLVSGKLA